MMNKRKIILIAYDLNPRKGSECSKADLWLRLLTKFFFVEVFTDSVHRHDIESRPYPEACFHFIETKGKLPLLFKKLGMYNLAYGLFIKKVKQIIATELLGGAAAATTPYTLIHCITPAGIFAYNDLYRLNLPVVIGPLGGGLRIPPGFEQIVKPQRFRYGARNFFYTAIRKRKKWQQYFLNACQIIVGTHYLKELLPAGCQDKIKIIFDTLVDPEVFKPEESETLETDTPTVKVLTFVGRMDMQKGSEILLAAFVRLVRDYPEVSLNFVGIGPLSKRLKDQVTAQGLEAKVTFWGKIPRLEVNKLLHKTDIFCLPTLSEPGGVSLLEAMACEVPVVTTNYGGPAFSVDESCGIKIEPESFAYYVSELHKALLELLKDDQRRRALGKNGRQRVIAEFSPQALEKKVKALYEGILGAAL